MWIVSPQENCRPIEREGSKCASHLLLSPHPMQRLLAPLCPYQLAKQPELLRIAQALDPMRLFDPTRTLTEGPWSTRSPLSGSVRLPSAAPLHFSVRLLVQRRFQLMYSSTLHPCSTKRQKKDQRLDGLIILAHGAKDPFRGRMGNDQVLVAFRS